LQRSENAVGGLSLRVSGCKAGHDGRAGAGVDDRKLGDLTAGVLSEGCGLGAVERGEFGSDVVGIDRYEAGESSVGGFNLGRGVRDRSKGGLELVSSRPLKKSLASGIVM
jgi:hypothetical protein